MTIRLVTLFLMLLTACASPTRPAEIDPALADGEGGFSLDFGTCSQLCEGAFTVRSLADESHWIYGTKTRAPSSFDPEQDDLQSVSTYPLEYSEQGVELPADGEVEFPMTYLCEDQETAGRWAVGLRVLVGAEPGAFETAAWTLGTIDLTGTCEETL